jgi:hypothetical protein
MKATTRQHGAGTKAELASSYLEITGNACRLDQLTHLREVTAMEAVMRYCVQPATAEDVALLATAMDSTDEEAAADSGMAEPSQQLVHAFVSSTHVWAARDRTNQPCALWGVGRASQDNEVGRFWLLSSTEVGTEAGDMVALSIMILPEMLTHYRRLESIIDARNVRAVELVKLIGFTIETARIHELTGRLCHRVWVDSDETGLPRAEPMRSRLLN